MAKTILTLTPVATPLRPSSGQSGRSSGGARLAVPRVACPYRRKWAECMPPTNISGLSQVVTGLTSSVPRMAVCSSLLCCTPPLSACSPSENIRKMFCITRNVSSGPLYQHDLGNALDIRLERVFVFVRAFSWLLVAVLIGLEKHSWLSRLRHSH